MTATKMTAQEIIQFIADAKKRTNVKVTFEGKLVDEVSDSVVKLGNVLFGDWEDIEPLLADLIHHSDTPTETICFHTGSNQGLLLERIDFIHAYIVGAFSEFCVGVFFADPFFIPFFNSVLHLHFATAK